MVQLTMVMSCPVEQASKDALLGAGTWVCLSGLNAGEIQEASGDLSLWLLTSREKESTAEWTTSELVLSRVLT